MTAAQVLLAWQFDQGIVFNPRTMSLAHQKENLGAVAFGGKLDDDRAAIQALPADACSATNKWYECCGGSQPSIPHCS